MVNPIAQSLIQPFVWGRGGAALTPEQVAREREIAEALMAGAIDTSPVGHWLQGAARMANAAVGNIRRGRADAAEKSGKEAFASRFSNIFGGGSDVAPSLAGSPATSTAMATAPAPDIATARVAQANGDSTAPAGKQAYDLASFLAPDKDQSHIQFKGDFGSRLGSFLAAAPEGGISIYSGYRSPERQRQLWDQAVKKYGSEQAARKWVAPPGRSNHNHGTAADLRYASDAQRKWAHDNANKFGLHFRMGHEPWHIEPLADWQGSGAPGGAVAANEAMASGELANPSLPPDAIQQWAAQNYAPEQAAGVTVAETPEEILAAEAAMAAPQGTQPRLEPAMAAPPMTAPQTVSDMPVADIAQSLTRNAVNPDLPMAGNTSGFAPIAQSLAQQAPAQPQYNTQDLVAAISDPWASKEQRAIATALLEQQMQQQDPYRQAQLQKLQLEMEQMRNPTPKETDDIREYNYAREQGYQGSFTDFMTDMRRAGATNVNVGGEGAPGLGKLSPDYGYVLDPETRQPVIDPATGLPRSAPIPGSPAAIAAEQAAAEQERLAGAQTRSDADKAETTLDATGAVLDIMRDAETPATGTLSRPFSLYSGTPAGRVRSYVKTLQSGVALGAMQRLKEMSATGATGFGALSAPELDLLINDIGALDPDNTEPEIFINTVERIRDRSRRVAQDIAKNVSPERIQELGLQGFIDGFSGGQEQSGNDGWMDMNGIKIRRKQ